MQRITLLEGLSSIHNVLDCATADSEGLLAYGHPQFIGTARVHE
jgi:hypothetical protein